MSPWTLGSVPAHTPSTFFPVLGMGPRASHVLGKLSTTEPHLQPPTFQLWLFKLGMCYICICISNTLAGSGKKIPSLNPAWAT